MAAHSDWVNWTRYVPGQTRGHYESFFQRANHPRRPLAFWIRYTLFSPRGHPGQASGELWAIFFDGERGRHVAVREQMPLADCHFEGKALGVRIGAAELRPGSLFGRASDGSHGITWDLSCQGESPPVFLLPVRLYEWGFPRAKSLVSLPLAVYSGSLAVDDRKIIVDHWVGSQNHNWGRRHTDHYAWGQVAGFDNAPGTFLEVATVRLRLGPLWTPPLTPLVLRHQGREHLLTSLRQSLRARAEFRCFHWNFRSETERVLIRGRVEAPEEAFVHLKYSDPPGRQRGCFNSKIAACQLSLTCRRSGMTQTLVTRNRAAFEILPRN